MSGREHLPGRRLHENDHTLVFPALPQPGDRYHVGIGRAAGSRRILEVFIRPGGDAGRNSRFRAICDDVGLVISYLLRSGTTPAELAGAVAREGGLPGQADHGPDAKGPAASSFVGAVADLLAERQRELDALPIEDLLAELGHLPRKEPAPCP